MCPRPPAPIITPTSAGPEWPGRLGHRVVRGQAGVGQRGDVGRLQRVVELDDAAGGGLEVFGVPAVGVDARERAVRAVHVVTGPAGAAQPAGGQRVQDHLVADRRRW